MEGPHSESAEPPVRAAASAAAASDASARVGPWTAHVAAWGLLALSNATVIALTPLPTAGLSVRLLHHAYDAGQLVGAGLLSGAVAAAWRRFGPARAGWGLLALAAAAVMVGAATIAEEVAGPGATLGGERWAGPVSDALVVAVSLGVPASALVGRLLAVRPELRALGVAAVFVIGLLNDFVLQGGYPGAHLFLGWAAAALGAATLEGARLGEAASVMGRARGRRVALAALVGGCVWALVTWPRQAVLMEIGRVQGAVLQPFLVRLRDQSIAARSAVPAASRPWFVDRSGAPDVPPSAPPLVGQDAVVVFLTIDAMRGDLLDRDDAAERFPRIMELARQAVVFTQARTPGGATRHSLGSTFTGKYHSQLLWSSEPGKRVLLSEDPSPRLAQLLADASVPGWTALAYRGISNSSGIASGFEVEVPVPARRGQSYALAVDMAEHAVERIEAHDEGPLFLFMHLTDAHSPYDAAGSEGSDWERYLREVSLCDAAVGRIWDALARRGLLGRAVFVVSADHGEAFGEHSRRFHAGDILYDEVLRVPLIVRVPGVPARTVDEPVSLLDLGPTLLDLLRLPTPGHWMGQSLVPFLRGGRPDLTRPVVADAGETRGMVVDGLKVIDDGLRGQREIYDLRRDPGEQENLYDALGVEGERRIALLRALLDAHRLDGAGDR